MNLLGTSFLLTLVVSIPIYWALPRTFRMPVASLVGLFCLAWFAPASAVFCLTLALCSYVMAKHGCSLVLAYVAGIAMFTSLLAFREVLNWYSNAGSVVPWLGAAFFTLRAINYLVSSAQNKIVEHRFIDYFYYLFFPPTLVVGPVQRFSDFEREARRCRFDTQRLSAGLERILFGYAKVVLFADYLIGQKFSSFILTVEPGSLHTYLECLEYGLGLYFKFAGYSDVAIGFGLLLGIRLPENFNNPFFAKNIADFWRRWHISVSSWCRDHVTFPLYASTRSLGLSALVAMLVLGLWHECSVRYLLWGAYHGLAILIWQRWSTLMSSLGWKANTEWYSLYGLTARTLTFNFVIIGFAITRAHNLGEAISAFQLLAGF